MSGWSGTGDAYAVSYAALCAGTGAQLRELAGAPLGRSLLDVGSGDGRLAGEWQDAGWQVTACEPEPSMRAAARRRHPDLVLVDGMLPTLPFEDNAFDVVSCNFVLNHVPDPRAAARELRRIARDAVIATTWSASPSSFWAEVTARSGLTPRAGGRLPADKDFERSAAGFERMLGDAGWHPEVSELTWTWMPSAATLWHSVEGGVGGAGAFYAALDAASRGLFRAAFDALVAEAGVDGAVPHAQTAAIAIDRRIRET